MTRRNDPGSLSLYKLWLQDMTNFTESGAEEDSLWMCVGRSLQFKKMLHMCAFLGTSHIHCWEILYHVFRKCAAVKIILFALYLMTVNRTVSSVKRQDDC